MFSSYRELASRPELWVAFCAFLVVLVASWVVFRLGRRARDTGARTPRPAAKAATVVSGLEKTRRKLAERLALVFGREDREAWAEGVLEALLLADVGAETASRLVARIRKNAGAFRSPEELLELLRQEVIRIFPRAEDTVPPREPPVVIFVVGVNGVGKTTTIGKLAYRFTKEGKKVLVVAADTFRAAAIEQLETWASRVGCDLVRHRRGSDPAAVLTDGLRAARSRGADVALVDTAGRLHVKRHLMEELRKLGRVAAREVEGAPHETWLVLDATTGQNALRQAEVFLEALPVTGLIVTKLDGTAKGGALLPVVEKLGLPVRFVGVGEGIEDLRPFDAAEFAEGLVPRVEAG
ncbi:MAG: signal recognition particle receptor FtsY [Candidatus Binatia bacterium]|nr:MAG: signal recognition particle receptor FtsY [Candidatus Binatia bacterium]